MRFFSATNKESQFHKEIFPLAKKSRLGREEYMKNNRGKLTSAFSDHFGKEVTNQEGYYLKIGFKKIGDVFENYKHYKIDKFCSLLSQNGPMLATGQYGKPVYQTEQLLLRVFDRFPRMDNAGYRLKISNYLGGNHAIVIWGASVENNCVFYSDPNFSFLDKVLQINFDLFKQRLDSLFFFNNPYAFSSKACPLAIFREV